MSVTVTSDNSGKLTWVEPTVTDLNIEETQGVPNRGGDRSIHADCTRS